MADVEFHVPTPSHDPTFIKPLDTASHRRSRASQHSAAASTRSWVLMNQHSPPPPAEPIPIPDPIPALAPTTPASRASRPLPEPPRRTSAINIEEEHMSVEMPPMGYQWESRRAPKQREVPTHKGFVGGFVSGLRRLPRALVRTRRPRQGTLHTEEGTEGTEQTGATGNTLPRYVSNPTTPVVPNTTVPFARNADADRQLRHPSFRIHPPEEDVGQGADAGDAQQQQRGGRDPTMVEFPETPLENPYDREATSVHDTPLAAPSLHPSRADDHLAVHPTELDNDEPVSVRAHPLPTADYRRMSAADAAQPQSRTTISSGSFSSGSPSFSAELNVNGISRFLNALHLLPWVAAKRITVDYEPKERSRSGPSWYYPKGESDARRALPATASPASPASPTRPHTRSPPRHRTHHRRASTPPITASALPTAPAFPIAYQYYPAFSPSPPPPSPPPSQVPRSHRRPSPPPRRMTARSSHRHHRRSAAYHSPQPVSMSMPAPWGSPSLLPAPPPPIYIVQASPAPTLAMPSPPPPAAVAMPPPAPPSSAQGTSGSAQGTPGSGFGSPAAQPLPHAHPSPRSDRSGGSGSGKAHPQMFGLGLTPVFMQMQVVPLSPSPSPAPPGSPQPQQVAFVPGDARYGYSYPYGYGVGIGAPAAYSGGWSGSAGSAGTGSPIAMPPPVQTAGG
ncbi:hypothetical protein MSAN_01947600 [Mycena sanguinolenta]|uniref:Uncharacterized protein n=1 Tax=Mycena sanguinolenta TaxID=230812 RepID=A0A8H7CPP1_9AGAR|nr:hypothetical protein MSAN_01947600 [Mycena sanguinolenta]